MKQKYGYSSVQNKRISLVIGIGVAMTAIILLMRVLLTPGLWDGELEHYAVSYAVIAVTLITVAALALLCRGFDDTRVDIRGRWTVPVAMAALFAGGALGISSVWNAYNWLVYRVTPPPSIGQVGGLSQGILLLMMVFGILGGVAFIRWGLQVAAENGTRRGMITWGALAPVLWIWFRFARYEMSYASAVRLTECFYDFIMFILEMLFLFKLARFISGVGKVSAGNLLFYAMSAAVVTLSGPLTRLCMFLMGDAQAYLASQLAGMTDFAMGVLALVVAIALADGLRQSSAAADADQEDAPSVMEVSAESAAASEPSPEESSQA